MIREGDRRREGVGGGLRRASCTSSFTAFFKADRYISALVLTVPCAQSSLGRRGDVCNTHSRAARILGLSCSPSEEVGSVSSLIRVAFDGPCESDKVLDTLRLYRDHMETKKTVLTDETRPRLCGSVTLGSHVTA